MIVSHIAYFSWKVIVTKHVFIWMFILRSLFKRVGAIWIKSMLGMTWQQTLPFKLHRLPISLTPNRLRVLNPEYRLLTRWQELLVKYQLSLVARLADTLHQFFLFRTLINHAAVVWGHMLPLIVADWDLERYKMALFIIFCRLAVNQVWNFFEICLRFLVNFLLWVLGVASTLEFSLVL